MFIIQVSNNKVIDIINARTDATQDSIRVISDIPVFEHREGFSGILMFDDEQGIYWEYIENPVVPEPESVEEKALAYDIIAGKEE